MKIRGRVILVMWLCLLMALPAPSLMAQAPILEEDDSLWQDEKEYFEDDFELDELDFRDSLDEDELDRLEEEALDAREFGIEGEGEDGEFDDDSYIDEGVVPTNTKGLLELELFRRKALLEEERINAPFNVAYGVGTGLMIGGWFALLFAHTSRDTLRSIGLGIVLGGIMGIVIGTRSVLTPEAPRPEEALPSLEASLEPQYPPNMRGGQQVAFEFRF